MTVAVVVVLLAGAVALGLVIAWPVLVSRPAETAGPDADPGDRARRDAEDDLQRSLQAIKEIEFDRAAGHLSDEDFAALDAAERARAVEAMRRRDALGGTGGAAAPPDAGQG